MQSSSNLVEPIRVFCENIQRREAWEPLQGLPRLPHRPRLLQHRHLRPPRPEPVQYK